MSNKGLEQEATLKSSSEELQVKSKELLLLQNQVKELEEKLQQADATLKQKVSFYFEAYLLGMGYLEWNLHFLILSFPHL